MGMMIWFVAALPDGVLVSVPHFGVFNEALVCSRNPFVQAFQVKTSVFVAEWLTFNCGTTGVTDTLSKRIALVASIP